MIDLEYDDLVPKPSIGLCLVCLKPIETTRAAMAKASRHDAGGGLTILIHDDCLASLSREVDKAIADKVVNEGVEKLQGLVDAVSDAMQSDTQPLQKANPDSVRIQTGTTTFNPLKQG